MTSIGFSERDFGFCSKEHATLIRTMSTETVYKNTFQQGRAGHRTRFAILNYASSLGMTLSTLLVGLAATPLILRWLGEERWGAYRVLVDLFGHLGVLELGLSWALLPMLAKAYTENDQSQQRHLLVLGFRRYLIVAAGMLAAATAMWLCLGSLVPVQAGLRTDLSFAFIALAATAILIPLTTGRLMLEASQRSYIVNLVLFGQMLAITGCALLLARAGAGITGQAVAMLLATLVVSAVWGGYLLRRFPGLGREIVCSEVSTDLRNGLNKLNVPSLLLNVCGRLSLTLDNLMVGIWMGPAAVVPFFLTQRLLLVSQQQLQNVSNAGWAGMSELFVQKRMELFNQRMIEMTRLVVLLGMAILIPIVLYNRHFLGLWVGDQNYAGNPVCILSAINALLMSVISTWSMAFLSAGILWPLVRIFIAQATVNVLLSVAFTSTLGMVGPVMGTLAGFLLVTLWRLPLLMRKHFQMSLWQLGQAVALPLVIAGAYATAWSVMLQGHQPDGWIGLVGETGTSVLLFLVLVWIVVFRPAERRLWRDRFRALTGAV